MHQEGRKANLKFTVKCRTVRWLSVSKWELTFLKWSVSFAWFFPVYIWLSVSECYHPSGEIPWQTRATRMPHISFTTSEVTVLAVISSGWGSGFLPMWRNRVSECEVATNCGSDGHFSSDTREHLLLCLLDICVPSLEKCLLKPYGHFKLDCLSFDCHVSLTLSLGHLSFFYFYCCLEILSVMSSQAFI